MCLYTEELAVFKVYTVCFSKVTITTVLLIISSLKTVKALTHMVIEENTYENNQQKIIVDLINNYASGQFIHIVNSEEKSTSWFWCNFQKKGLPEKWSIRITILPNPKNDNNVFIKPPDVYVIFFHYNQTLEQFYNIITDLVNKASSWNPRAIFLFVATVNKTFSPSKDQFAVDVFNYVWKRNIFRVSLVIFNENTKDITHLSSLPYFNVFYTCKKIINSSQLQQINLVNEVPSGNIMGSQFKNPSSFLGCPLIGHTFPFPPYSVAEIDKTRLGNQVYKSGIEVNLVTLLANLYNFSLEITSTLNYGNSNGWFQKFPNGSSYGMLEDIMQYNIDLAFAGGIPTSEAYFRVSLTNTYIDNSISWYVPDPEIMPNWKLVLNTFSGTSWLIMALLCLFVSLIYILMSKFNRNKSEGPVDLIMVALTVGLAIRWTKKTHIRFLLLAWSMFSFHVTLTFTTRLFSVLTNRPLDSGINTLNQLQDSMFKLCIGSTLQSFYINQTDGIIKNLIENTKICENLGESIKVLLEYKNISILAKDDHLAFSIDEERAHIHKLKEKFINYPVMMSVAKGSIFLEYLNRLIQRVTESGIVLKWLEDTIREEKTFSIETNYCNSQNLLLKSEDLFWLYKLFLCGQSVALIVVVIEIVLKKVL